MPALSEFRRRKLYFIFDRFFDVNHSGTIEKKDFELAVEQICRIRGWSKGDTKYVETSKNFLEIWDALRSSADANKDDQVSRDEWCQLWSDEAASEDWQRAYMRFMFNLQDTSGDGCIDLDEFTSVCTSFGINADESRRAFDTISQNGKVKVDMGYYSVLWKEFFYSDDAKSTGTCIFGKTSFD
ncbi:unnamed protein product [Orchesella dallaii]|uniref:EF-hand domain-containing protein n=1 Tax=Orchesella dallaii TaxID=48710 RepID=A0ABP1RWW1_9HEXA